MSDSPRFQAELTRFIRSFVELHHVPIWFIRASDGAILEANPAAVAFYGYDRETLLSMKIWDINMLGPQTFRENAARAVHEGHGQFLLPHRLASGEIRQVQVFTTVVDLEGETVLMSTIYDQTERLGAEEQLRASEEKYKTLFDLLSTGVVITDAEGQIVDANRASERILGLTRQTHLERRFDATDWTILRPDGSPMPAEEYASVRALREGRTVEGVEMQVVRPDGERRWLRVDATPIPVEGYGVAIVHVDITALKQAQAELVRLNKHYQSIMDIAQDGIHVLDPEGHLIDANQAFLHSIQATREDIPKLHVRDWDAFFPEGQLLEKVRELIDAPSLFETRHRRRDGTVFDVEVHAGGVKLDDHMYQLAASRDISARKALERQKEEFLQQMEERVRQEVQKNLETERLMVQQARLAAMGEMIGNIAHQWRQPLNALGLVLANIGDAFQYGELNQECLDGQLRDGMRLVGQMSQTITDFSEFFRPDREPLAFSARRQAEAAVALVEASYRYHGVRLSLEPGDDANLLGFPHEYAQVLLNLLSNARDASLEGGQPEPQVTVRLVQEGKELRLEVLDNGPGIPGHLLDRIFEPYFSTKAGGTGLGLYMSRVILERSQQGRLEAQNLERGARFSVISSLEGSPSQP